MIGLLKCYSFLSLIIFFFQFGDTFFKGLCHISVFFFGKF